MTPFKKGELVSVYPPAGPGTYRKVGQQILSSGHAVPDGDMTASLIHAAYDSDEPEFRDIRGIMRNAYLWLYGVNCWEDDGVYVVKDLDAEGIGKQIDIEKLRRQLSRGKECRNVIFCDGFRFAPKGTYKDGRHTGDGLAKDGFVIATFGEECAEKLGYVSSKLAIGPHLWVVDSGRTVSALEESYGGRIDVDGDYFDHYRGGRALGVRAAAKEFQQ